MPKEAQQILDLIIRPLTPLHGMGDEHGEFLLCYTGAVESGYDNLRQILPSGNYGLGHGWFQMEPFTYADCVQWLDYFPELRDRILKACLLDKMPDVDVLLWNIRFSACMARVRYYRHGRENENLPRKDDLTGLAQYWLRYYNGNGEGKGSIERFVNVAKSLNLK